MERDYVRLCHYAGYGMSEGDSRSQVPMFFELDKFLGRHELTRCTMDNLNIWAYPIEKFPETVQSDSVSEVCDYIRRLVTSYNKKCHEIQRVYVMDGSIHIDFKQYLRFRDLHYPSQVLFECVDAFCKTPSMAEQMKKQLHLMFVLFGNDTPDLKTTTNVKKHYIFYLDKLQEHCCMLSEIESSELKDFGYES